MPINLLDLNVDVLGHIVFQLDSADARRLSRTAHHIHSIADHHALQYVTLRSLPKVTKFCTYMLNEKRHRLLSLRELRIPCLLMPRLHTGHQKPPSELTQYEEAARLVADLIQEAKGLQVLTLYSVEYWLQHEPRLSDALSSLRHLLDIELQNLGPNTSKIIVGMRSAPRKLIFSLPGVGHTRGFLPHCPFPGKLNLDAERCMPSVQYLAVIDNTILPDPTVLTRVFPALRSLEIKPGKLSRSTAADPRYSVNWPSLERVRGLSHILCLWQNATPVHLLHLTDLLHFHGPPRNGQIRPVAGTWTLCPVQVLSSFQPVAFIAQLDSDIPTCLWRQLLEYTGSFGSLGGSARLRYVSVELSDVVTRETAATELKRWWSNAASAVKASGIICLEIRCPLRSGPPLDWALATQTVTTLEDNLPFDETVFHTFPARVGNAAPALRYLSLDLSPGAVSHRRHDFLDLEYNPLFEIPSDLRWWSFDHDPSGRVVRPLDPARGEQIAAYLRSTRYDYSSPFDESEVPY